MKKPVTSLLDDGTLKPATELKVNEDNEKDYEDGFIYEKTPEILTPGHLAHSSQSEEDSAKSRKMKIAERAKFSNYLISPTRFKFDKVVRILGYVKKHLKIRFEKSASYQKKICQKAKETKFSILHISSSIFMEGLESQEGNVDEIPLQTHFNPSPVKVVVAEVEKNVELEPEDINKAICDIFVTATNEVKRFNSEAFVKKTSTEKNGVLYQRG